MGRSKKKHQRTKGNVKPSSSSKAAEMLVQDGKTGFMGFGGLSESMGNAFGYVPKSIGDEGDEHSIDSELRMLMRKMGKKDTITRLKAVQEFSQLCPMKEADDIVNMLSFWPRIYNKLSEDYDHRVREAVQLAHLEIATKAGRALAPQLKIIISSWMKSQFDQYAPAASAARRSFDITFPDDKKKDVVSFCRKGLLLNMYDTLIKQTRDTLSDPSVIPEEEREAKYNRHISSTLLSFGYIMEMLQKDDITNISEEFESIFDEKKFWKFSKHHSPMVRTAFFTVLSSACQNNSVILQNHKAVLFPTVLCSLDESDPTVVSSYWECLLHIVDTFEECWNHVNARKAVLPKLWSVLRKGGFGSATVVFPNILPLLSRIPRAVVGDGIGFARELFSNMKEGLFHDKVVSSQSESIAVMTAFMECLRYILFNFHQDTNVRDETTGSIAEEEDGNLIEYLINGEIGYVLQCCMEARVYPWRTTFLAAFRDLLTFTEMQSAENNYKGDICNQTIAMAHTLLQNVSISVLNAEEESDYSCVRRRFTNLEELIKIVVFRMEYSNQRRKRQVEFIGYDDSRDADINDKLKNDTRDDYISCSDSKMYNLSECTRVLLETVSSHCIELLFKRREVIYLEFLSDIISCIDSSIDLQQMIAHILRVRQSLDACEDIPKWEETPNLHHGLIRNIVQPIMRDDFASNKSYWISTDCQEAVVCLFCKILKCMDENEMVGFLRSITEIAEKPYMFSWLVQKVLSTIDIKASISWFKSCDIWSQLITFAADQCNGGIASSEQDTIFNSVFNCIETCLFLDGGSLCTEEATDTLFNIFKNHLVSETYEDTKKISRRILAILAKFYNSSTSMNMVINGSTELLIATFQLMNKVDDKKLFEQASHTLKRGFIPLLKSSGTDHHPVLESVLQKIAYWAQRVCFSTSCGKEIQTLACCCAEIINFFSSDEVKDANFSYSHRFLSQLVSSLGKYIQCTDFSSQANLLDAILMGTVSLNILPIDVAHCQSVNRSELNNALFVIELISCVDDFELNREIVVNALLNTVCVLCLAMENSDTEDDFDMLAEADKVESSIKELLLIENIQPGYLMNSAMERALESSGLYTLALKKLFELLPESTLLKFPVSDLLGRAMSHGQNDSNSLDGFKVILAHMEDLSITRALVEQYVDQLCNEDSETLKGFNFTLELCISALIHWQSMLDCCSDSLRDFGVIIQTILTHLIGWRDESQDALLFSVDLADATGEQLALNINLMRLISFSLDCGGGSELNSNHWDFILCSLASWIQTCEENVSTLKESYRKIIFTFWACNLCTSVSATFERKIGGGSVAMNSDIISLKCNTPWTTSDDWKRRVSNRISDDLVTEWQEFFTPAIFKSVYSLYIVMLDYIEATNIEAGHWTMVSDLLKSICCSLYRMPSTLLLDIVIGNSTFEEQLQQGNVSVTSTNTSREYDSSQIEMIQKAYCQFVHHLDSKILCLQILAHAFLCKMMIVAYSTAQSLTTESIEGDECDIVRSFPDKLMDVLQASQDQILSYLDENSSGFGSYFVHQPPTDVSRYILAFLLSWQITLRQFRDSEAGHRAAFANFMRKRNLIGPMMTIVFSMLPHDKGHLLSVDPVEVDGDLLSLRHIRQLSFHLYLAALECIPAVIRSWCNNNLDKKSAIITERFTTAFASPILCTREIDQVSNSSKTFTNMFIKTRPAAREVVALYSVEEISMELVVKMSPSHPLGPVAVECGKRVGVSSAQWRQWMLQLTMYLTQQNGMIVDGLTLWKRNVDKKFEGVEECMICFSVVHGTNYQLPTIICRVCKKRFHSACLYKWFNTSNKSTCPLCRTSF